MDKDNINSGGRDVTYPICLPLERKSDAVVFGGPVIMKQGITLVPEQLDRDLEQGYSPLRRSSIDDHVYRLSRLGQRSRGLCEVILSAAEYIIAAAGPQTQREVDEHINIIREELLRGK